MFDARIFPLNLKDAEVILHREHAVCKGDYLISDKIYESKDPKQTLDKIFLRLRLVPKNIWRERPVVVALKNTELKKVGKQSKINVKQEFDTEAEAQEFIDKNYSNEFQFSFEFNRKGWQYFLGEDGIDLEDIEGHYSIEFKSKTEEGLQKLLDLFGVKPEEVIKGPSVVAVKEFLKK
mgnify:CR=1 FL=1